jgi:hypothetical protein
MENTAVGKALAGTSATPGWLSPGSLLTFPASSAAIKGAWEVIRIPTGSWGDSTWVPILMGMLIAIAFYATNFPEKSDPNRTAKIFAGVVLVPFTDCCSRAQRSASRGPWTRRRTEAGERSLSVRFSV